MDITPIRQAVLGELVARDLRRLIVTGRLPIGTPLIEGQLAAQYDVSRGPVRDAIRLLSSEGLVSTEGRSATVRGLSSEDVDELFSLREALEKLAVSLAIQSPELLDAELAAALTAMDAATEAGDVEAFNDADMRFHSSFYLAAGHRRLSDVWAQYRPTIEMLVLGSTASYTDLHWSGGRHHDLARVVATRDLDVIHQEIHEHLDNARLRFRSHYPPMPE